MNFAVVVSLRTIVDGVTRVCRLANKGVSQWDGLGRIMCWRELHRGPCESSSATESIWTLAALLH